MKAMLFCAGLGTRMKPFTLEHPKCLFPVLGKTLLERNLCYLKAHGISEVVINVHHFGDQIIDFLNAHQNFGLHIDISDESSALLETGGGLIHARRFFDTSENFLVFNSDILTDIDLTALIDYHNTHQPLATLAVSERPSTRGLYFNNESRLCGWENTATGESIGTEGTGIMYAFSGLHVLNPNIFSLLPAQGTFSIMTEYLKLMDSQNIIPYIHSNILVDVGRPESVPAAENAILHIEHERK